MRRGLTLCGMVKVYLDLLGGVCGMGQLMVMVYVRGGECGNMQL